jgi:hypothetical protein
MFARTTRVLAVLMLAAPAAAVGHGGPIPHVHPHTAPLVMVLLLTAAVVVARVVGRRRV